jgi:hypothetical protein
MMMTRSSMRCGRRNPEPQCGCDVFEPAGAFGIDDHRELIGAGHDLVGQRQEPRPLVPRPLLATAVPTQAPSGPTFG